MLKIKSNGPNTNNIEVTYYDVPIRGITGITIHPLKPNNEVVATFDIIVDEIDFRNMFFFVKENHPLLEQGKKIKFDMVVEDQRTFERVISDINIRLKETRKLINKISMVKNDGKYSAMQKM